MLGYFNYGELADCQLKYIQIMELQRTIGHKPENRIVQKRGISTMRKA